MQLQKKTVVELKKLCKANGKKGYSKLKKKQLISLLSFADEKSVTKKKQCEEKDCLEKKSIVELKKLCKANGKKGYSKLKKTELIHLLTHEQVASKDSRLLDISSWKKQIPPKKGGNPAKIFFSPRGMKYYGKISKNYERIETELLASKLYQLANVQSTDMKLAKCGKDFVLLVDWKDGIHSPKSLDNPKIQDGFIVDCWLANWDASHGDNIMMDNKGNPIRMDVGGSLDYRALGKKKGVGSTTPFAEKVGQIKSMKKKGKHVDFTSISLSKLKSQVSDLSRISDVDIYETVHKNVKDETRADKLTSILIARRNNIIEQFSE